MKLEFHNAVLERRDGLPGWFLPRFPEAVRAQLDIPYGRLMAPLSAGVEIRFVTEAPYVDVTLSAHGGPCEVEIERGDFPVTTVALAPGSPQVLRLSPPAPCGPVPREALSGGRFSPDMWRLVCDGGGTVVFHSLDAMGWPVRPPTATEKPARTWLAYGSSITHGHKRGYVQHAARALGVDLLNKGISGACACEPAVAEFLAGLTWDFATLELGVNMTGYAVDEFQTRAHGLVRHLVTACPGRPLFLITTFPLAFDHHADPQNDLRVKTAAFREALRGIAAAVARDGVQLIEGREVLPGLRGLSADLVHPSDFGHAQMGCRLAAVLGERLAWGREP